MESLHIDARARDWLSELGLTSSGAILKYFVLPEPPLRHTVTVTPRSMDGRSVYCKLYEYRAPSWRFWLRRSKARCEFENYAAFEQIGIPTARRVACGEVRDGIGRLCRAFVITEAIPRAWTLPDFVEEYCPKRDTTDSRQLRDELCRQLAVLVQRIHDAGFYHHDLVWRNILVTWAPPDSPKIWWIDCPRGGFSRQHRRQIKDLASLDKMAAKHCTRTERMLFLKTYGGGRELAEEILRYRNRRWPNG
jgi:tRNA A-37 threonylcarbamoyl transferase component Bud32